MKKQKLLLLLPFLVLTACGKTEDTSSNRGEETQEQQSTGGSQTDGGTQTGGGTQGGGTSGGGSQTGGGETSGGGSETGGGGGQTVKPHDYEVPNNTPYKLEDYTKFDFYNGEYVEIPVNWNFYHGTSLNPNSSCHWQNKTVPEKSGMEFIKNTYIVSPQYECWNKLEIRFEFWFSSHTSDKYKGTDNKPQFFLECYDQYENKLETKEINIARADIPKNNTTKTITQYVYQPTCNHFILRWNNYIPNGNSGYSAILVSSTLKGRPYSN